MPLPDGNKALPEYARPPVVEVALAVEFGQPVKFRSIDLGRLAEAWSGWPVVEERPVLPPMDPSSDDDLLGALFGDDDPPPRLWLQNDAGDGVVQIQHDRLVVNWRKGDAGGIYPRYGAVREQLQDAWERVAAVCTELELDDPVPSLCEIQYVNSIASDHGWTSPKDTEVLMVPWRGLRGSEFFAANHLTQFRVHSHFPEDRKGWLTIDCWTSHSSPSDPDDCSPVMSLNLTARGRAESGDFESALDFFDVAHRWIVEGFTEITTLEAHKIWKRLH